MPHMDRLHVSGPMASQFLKMKVGKDVSFTVKGRLVDLGLQPEYSTSEPGKEPKKEKPIPHAEIQILSIDGIGGKKIEDMDEKETEREIAKAKGYK